MLGLLNVPVARGVIGDLLPEELDLLVAVLDDRLDVRRCGRPCSG